MGVYLYKGSEEYLINTKIDLLIKRTRSRDLKTSLILYKRE